MDSKMEKHQETIQDESFNHGSPKKPHVEVKILSGNEAFQEALIKEPPRRFSRIALILYACSLVGFLCSTMNGYDGSLFNSLLLNPHFKAYFHGSNNGIWAGIVASMYQIGGVVALPTVGYCVDLPGRRGGMFIGAFTIIVGTIIQGTTAYTRSLGQFMAGRFLLGFGVSIAASAGPVYVVEVSHPAFRGVVTALYNTFWCTGNILAAGISRGSLNRGGETSWLIPVWLQLMCSVMICTFCLFVPESPRWLYAHGKRDAAKAMITKYHGEGREDSVWVQLQLQEYETYLSVAGSDRTPWDFRPLFKDRATSQRVLCNVIISVFGQWAGNSVLSYYLGAVLDTVGITDPVTQNNITLGLACTGFVIAIIGSMCVDKIGRRPLLLFTNAGCTCIWVGMIIATSQFAKTKSVDAAKTMQAMIYLFGMCYSFGFTPMQALYPVEVLSFEIRAKGMAFSSMVVNAAGLMNHFAWPVSLKKIGWKTYICFAIWDAIQTTVIYFFIPETKGRTLEELDEIFQAKNSVKFSLQKKKVGIDSNNNVHVVEQEA